jgi:hypothetical protein
VARVTQNSKEGGFLHAHVDCRRQFIDIATPPPYVFENHANPLNSQG